MKTSLRNILIFFGILFFLALLWYFRNIVVYILVSGVLSVMGRPLVDLLGRIRIGKLKVPRVGRPVALAKHATCSCCRAASLPAVIFRMRDPVM